MKVGIKWQFQRKEQVNAHKDTEDHTGKQHFPKQLNVQIVMKWL